MKDINTPKGYIEFLSPPEDLPPHVIQSIYGQLVESSQLALYLDCNQKDFSGAEVVLHQLERYHEDLPNNLQEVMGTSDGLQHLGQVINRGLRLLGNSSYSSGVVQAEEKDLALLEYMFGQDGAYSPEDMLRFFDDSAFYTQRDEVLFLCVRQILYKSFISVMNRQQQASFIVALIGEPH